MVADAPECPLGETLQAGLWGRRLYRETELDHSPPTPMIQTQEEMFRGAYSGSMYHPIVLLCLRRKGKRLDLEWRKGFFGGLLPSVPYLQVSSKHLTYGAL